MAAETPAPPAVTDDSPEQDAPFDWGKVLDAAGIAAGIILAVIVADILTDGRLISRRLTQRRQEKEETYDAGD